MEYRRVLVRSDPCNDFSPAWEKCNAPCDYTDATFNDSATLSPGVYCGGITWTGSGKATLEPGDYIIREGSLNIGANIAVDGSAGVGFRSEEHTSELQSLMRISYAVFCLKKKNNNLKN